MYFLFWVSQKTLVVE